VSKSGDQISSPRENKINREEGKSLERVTALGPDLDRNVGDHVWIPQLGRNIGRALGVGGVWGWGVVGERKGGGGWSFCVCAKTQRERARVCELLGGPPPAGTLTVRNPRENIAGGDNRI